MPYRSFSSRPSRGRRVTYQAKPKRRGGKEFINPERFIKAAKAASAEVFEPKNKFAEFVISDLLKANLTKKGIIVPSPIQDQAVPLGLAGKDVIGLANTGTGKTIAFAIPILQSLITNRSNSALIVAPTRELATQIEDEFKEIGRGSGLTGTLLIGGTAMGRQLSDLRHRPRIVIGTPGRIKDHLERGTLSLAGFNMVVLDEVDRMLDMGFVNDVRSILSKLPTNRQSFFFSATLDSRVEGLIKEFSIDAVMVSVKTGETIDTVEQNIVKYESKQQKVEKLHDLLTSQEVTKALVFDSTQRSVERLSIELRSRGFEADAIHGGKSQGQRQRALDKFKASQLKVLVATDVAARGIDVSDISHVINYSTPQSYSDYVHRIGRAGRAGRKGHALTFIEV